MFDRNFFVELSKYVDKVDYSSYTLQYPPPFIGDNYFDFDKYISSFIDIKEDMGLYIHIPFCDTKCSFCRYFSIIDNNENYCKYIKYLKLELKNYSDIFKKSKLKINSLYFGGGTPSILSEESLNILLFFIFSNFDISNDFQFCFEANPSSLNYSKIEILKKYNCNRLTIGVQSLNEDILKLINRNQTRKQVFQSIYNAKKIGINNINIDLMLGIKGQSLNSFLKDLKEIIYFKPDMIHLHPYTPTHRVIDNNLFDSDEILKQDMEKIGTILLKNNGYKNIEGDALGLKDDSKNKQLFDAINLGKYIGIGVSAVGFNGFYRNINTDNINEYYYKIDKGLLPIKFGSKLTKKDNMIQYIIYNMRYKKVSLLDFYDKFGFKLLNVFKKQIEQLESLGKVTISRDYLVFTFNGAIEYSIYSKYFYDIDLLKKAFKKIYY